jgi:catechol 2,3-dioxygenase-like lactoylglutathione lyase family enzyme
MPTSSLHTNAGGGQGTSTYIYDGRRDRRARPRLQTLRCTPDRRRRPREYDATWVDRGQLSANFGEVRLLSTMPGVLIELAFHDTDGSMRPHRAARARASATSPAARSRAACCATSARAPRSRRNRPSALRVTQDGARGLRLAWDSSPGALTYSIEQSPDGKGFVEIAQTSATTWSTGVLPHDAVWSFRVRACNSTGRSQPTDVLSAGTSHTKTAECLLVQGFDRRDKAIKEPANTKDYLRLHALALRAHGEFSLGFDAATNEAVALGRVALAPYRAVDWAAGEESTADESFSTIEQGLVAAYLAQGGRLLITGAEVAWDLDARGTMADRAFYNSTLGARYVADDAATYAFAPTATGVFAGLPAGLFDDGTGTTYDVDFPDVLGAFDANSAPCLLYGNGQVAGLQRSVGNSRVLHLGFPLETVRDAGQRAALLARALRYLLAPRLLDLAPSSSLGAPTPITLEIPAAANRPFLLAAALGTAPGLPLPGGFTLPLNPDSVFNLSLTPGTGVFNGFFGNLDGNGRASATLTLPNLPGLLGLPIFVSGFVLPDLSGLAVHTMLPWLRTVGR